MSLSDNYRMMASCRVKDGLTVMFWKDLWDLGVLQWQFPQLFSFATDHNISVAKFLQQDAYQNFYTPLSLIASDQLQDLSVLVQSLSADDIDADLWSYIWHSPEFSVKKAYELLQGNAPVSPAFKWLWESCIQGKHKCFFWLFLRDRLNTCNLLRRKHMFLLDYTCVLCPSGMEETLVHLFLTCAFSQACWRELGIVWNLSLLVPNMILDARQ